MSVNSSYPDLPLPPPLLPSSNNTYLLFMGDCFRFKALIYVFSAFYLAYILLLLPFVTFVLYLGYQKSRKQRSSSKASSHSDHLTYHSLFMQLIEFLGIAFFFICGFISLLEMFDLGISFLVVMSVGQGLFHLLTCVERYLAVVHPVTYLGLRQGGGVRIRNISTGCVWLFCLGLIPVFYLAPSQILYFAILLSFVSVLCFCSLSVLYVLKRPGPGGGGGNRERVDQSKQRAFYTIMGITGLILLRFGGNLMNNLITSSINVSSSYACGASLSVFFLGVPSSLVLPLLFLQRAGKLRCCKSHTESG